MSFRKNFNRRTAWIDYCSKNKKLIEELNVTPWVFYSEENFREFVTKGFQGHKSVVIYSFKDINEQTYSNLFNFINDYFDMDIMYFTNFMKGI